MLDLNTKECEDIKQKWWIKMHSTVTVWTKWQVVIPADVRELLWIKPWDSMMVVTKHLMAIWMVKTDNIEELMTYIKKEMEQ